MRPENLKSDCVSLRLSVDDLGTIGNALNEVCSGIRVTDFQIKMRAEREEVHQILLNIIPIYRKNDKAGSSHVVVSFSSREVRSIIGALKTVRREIDEFEFQTRMGAERAEVDQILDEITQIYSKMKQLE